MKLAKGFTLIELMVTVVILAIITAVAIPAYNGYVTRGKIAEATATLSGWRVQMEQYYQDNRTYLNPAGTDCGKTVPAGKYFTFTCISPKYPAPTQNTYTLAATGTLSMAGFEYTVDQLNNKQTTGAPAGWGVGALAPAGQIPPNPVIPCWVLNKNGQC